VSEEREEEKEEEEDESTGVDIISE